MGECSTIKVPCRNIEDIINELPTQLVENIIDRLPIDDAVRTSILSRKWRYHWTKLRHLDFTIPFYYTLSGDLDPDPVSGDLDPDALIFNYKYMSLINKFLLMHDGPILSFGISIPPYPKTISDFLDYLNQWTFLLSRNGIKELTVRNSSNIIRYKVSSYLFSCLALTFLRLVHVEFNPPPSFEGFTHLINLELESISYTASFNCKCPVLESLTLTDCGGISHLNFHAPNLKCLIVVNGNLFPFQSTETLLQFSLSLSSLPPDFEHTIQSNIVKVLGHLPRIESFNVGRYFFKYLAAGGVPNRLSTPLGCLKSLKITGINFYNHAEVSCLICLIRSAPSLCNLEIWSSNLHDAEEPADLENFCIQESKNVALYQLQTVTWYNLYGCKIEMELIKCILAHSPALKTMFIHQNKYVEADAALELAMDVERFPRASGKAKITTYSLNTLVEAHLLENDRTSSLIPKFFCFC